MLGGLFFNLYTADVLSIAAAFGIHVHAYADDLQLYIHCRPCDVDEATKRMIACIAAIGHWMSSNRLKLNPDKTQLTWFGSQQQLLKINVTALVMPDGSVIHPKLNMHIAWVYTLTTN